MRQRYHERFAGGELPVPVEAIAEDLLGRVSMLGQDLLFFARYVHPGEGIGRVAVEK